jgi:hypothetical protein
LGQRAAELAEAHAYRRIQDISLLLPQVQKQSLDHDAHSSREHSPDDYRLGKYPLLLLILIFHCTEPPKGNDKGTAGLRNNRMTIENPYLPDLSNEPKSSH